MIRSTRNLLLLLFPEGSYVISFQEAKKRRLKSSPYSRRATQESPGHEIIPFPRDDDRNSWVANTFDFVNEPFSRRVDGHMQVCSAA